MTRENRRIVTLCVLAAATLGMYTYLHLTKANYAAAKPSAEEIANMEKSLGLVKQGDFILLRNGEVYITRENREKSALVLFGPGTRDGLNEIHIIAGAVAQIVRRCDSDEYKRWQAIYCDQMAGISKLATQPASAPAQ